MKNKSKMLIVSTILNAIIGIEVIIVCAYVLVQLLSGLSGLFERETFAMSAILLWLPQASIIFIVIIAMILFTLCFFALLTCYISFKNNKKLWTIIHIIILIIVSLIGLFFSALRPQIVSTYFSNWFVVATVLRIIGYSNQKKIDKKMLSNN